MHPVCRTTALAAVVIAFGQTALAQGADICSSLLAQGIRDTESTQVAASRFNEIKGYVCTQNYDSYSKARSMAASGGFDIVGIFGISGGAANSDSEYGTKWSKFCQSSYSDAMSNTEFKSYYSVANQSLLHSFDHCVDVMAERFIRYVQTTSDGKTFNIVLKNRREGNATFKIEKLTLTDSSSGRLLNLLRDCDFNRSLPWDSAPYNAINIVCRKDATHAVVVNGQTSAGNVDPVQVPAVPDPGPSLAARVAVLEGLFQSSLKMAALASGNGDVMISSLTQDQFLQAHRDDGSTWRLCDGKINTIDLTGRYPRGQKTGLTPDVGQTQEDSLQSHTHRLPVPWQVMPDAKGAGDNPVARAAYGNVGIPTKEPEGARVDTETRPKTTIVNFFCRIRK